MLIVRSPVRISFGGGGSDLPAYYERFGGAVLSTSIDKYFYTILQKRTDGKIQVISSDLRVMETWRDISRMELKNSELAIPLAVIKELGLKISADLFLASEIVAGTGLGSSASDLLRQFESNLMLFFTGVAHNSWSLLHEQEQSTRKEAGSAVESLHEIRELADHMRRALLKADLRTFGALLHQGWEAKKRISSQISNPLIDEVYALARENGALGGKIAGAGGGGFLLLFCEERHQSKVREAIAKMELREMAFGLDFQGAEVVANDPFIDRDDKCGMRWTFAPALIS